LFDLDNDPQELDDLGDNLAYAEVRARMHEAIFAWARQHHNRITKSPQEIARMAGREPPGILIGIWDEADFERIFGKPFGRRP
jgi:hypothetical protein